MTILNSYFGDYGGMYVPQILIPALNQLEKHFVESQKDINFQRKLSKLLQNYAGRPTPLTLCKNITKGTNTKLYLKREDLLHGGAHKTNQVLAQSLLAKKMKKKKIIAETGAGQHGVATAFACALLNLKCKIYMGEKDIKRQKTNVLRMKLMGASIIPVTSGNKTLKDACNEALRDWSENYHDSHYMIGTVAGPHPYPIMVREFQKIIGIETKQQILYQESKLPDIIIACVGGGSNAIGIFHDFINDKSVELIGIEPGGLGTMTDYHGSPLQYGKIGIYFGMKSSMLQNQDGQIKNSHSISAGLDFPSVGPEHTWLHSIGRAKYYSITDEEAINAFLLLCKHEGIVPALESSHAIAYALKIISKNPHTKQNIIVNLSGRGDKDIKTIYKYMSKEGKNFEI